MNRIQKYLPILLVCMMLVSTYKLYSDKMGNKSDYNNYIKSADEYFEKGIIVDAASEIDKAIEMNPSIDLYLKKAGYYYDSENSGKALGMASSILELYPKDAKAYDYALNCFNKFKNFESCYDVLETAEKRGVRSKTITKYTEDLKYKYYIDGTNFEDFKSLSNSRYAVLQKGLWGYCGKVGALTVPCYFKYAGQFLNELAPVEDDKGNIYYIDYDGNKKLDIPKEIKVEKAGLFSESIAAIKSNNKFGYYNSDFKLVFGKYDYASTMFNSVAAVKIGNSWSLINNKGKNICKDQFEDIKINDQEIATASERIFAKKAGKYILLDTDGKEISKTQFDDAKCFIDGTYAAVEQNGKWGFVDKEGKLIIEPKYEDARSFSNELAAVKLNGKWGYIDKKDNLVIPAEYYEVFNMNSSGCAFVKLYEKDLRYSMIKLYRYSWNR